MLKKGFMLYLKWSQKSEFTIKIWDLKSKSNFDFEIFFIFEEKSDIY